MTILTERIYLSLPIEVKAHLQKLARQRGLCLSAIMREITSDLIFRNYVDLLAQAEQRGATGA